MQLVQGWVRALAQSCCDVMCRDSSIFEQLAADFETPTLEANFST